MNKGSGGDGIPVELFQVLKDDAVKVLHSICQEIWKNEQWPQDGKGWFSLQCQRKAMPKNAQTTAQLALISHASNEMLKILQASLQQNVNCELPDVQARFRKVRGTRDQITNIHWITKKKKSSGKTSTSALLTMLKPSTVWITTNCGKFFKRWEYQTTLPASWEICVQVKKQQLEPDMGQLIGSKLGNEYIQAVYCHPAYLTYMQSTPWEMPGWMKHKLESRLLGEISTTSDMQMKSL